MRCLRNEEDFDEDHVQDLAAAIVGDAEGELQQSAWVGVAPLGQDLRPAGAS